MNAAEEMVVKAARAAAESGDATALESSLLIIVDRQQAAIQRVRDVCMSSHVDDQGKKVVFLDRIQRALDGAE